MWMLDNRTAYAVGRHWLRDKQGAHHWLVAVKATFDIEASGKLKLADEQPPPLLAPEYCGEPGKSSLRADSDLLEFKPGTDILLDAEAHAPKGKPTETVPVGFRIGDLQKTLLVHGLRVYYRGPLGLTTSAPRPFTTWPIVYEWAYGGTDTNHPDPKKHLMDARNPVGKGVALNAARIENQSAHRIEYPSGNPAKTGPAGFGPIDRGWSPRLELGGTYDEAWEKNRRPLLPDDYDERFALSAPADQRTTQPLRGGETMSILNMTPEGTMRFDLPKILLTFETRFGGRLEEHRASLTTVGVLPHKRKLTLVWQSKLHVAPGEIDYLDVTRIAEKTYLR